MRIISSYKDYYDITLREGVDMTLVYERKYEKGGTIELPYDWNNAQVKAREHHFINPDDNQTTAYAVPNNWNITRGNLYKYSIIFTPVIFCGKYYPRWSMYVYDNSLVDYDKAMFFSNTKKEVLDQFYKKFDIEPPKSGRKKWRDRPGTHETLFTALPKVDWDSIHARENAPILTIVLPPKKREYYGSKGQTVNYIILKNPQLSQVQFQNVIDPWTAYQELSMYMGGIMANHGKPMVQLTDKDVHAKHGFDKWSFRKMPEN